jgi:hypothetical protein
MQKLPVIELAYKTSSVQGATKGILNGKLLMILKQIQVLPVDIVVGYFCAKGFIFQRSSLITIIQ